MVGSRFRWRKIHQPKVRAALLGILPPCSNHSAGMCKVCLTVRIQALVTEPSIETLDVGILVRLPCFVAFALPPVQTTIDPALGQ